MSASLSGIFTGTFDELLYREGNIYENVREKFGTKRDVSTSYSRVETNALFNALPPGPTGSKGDQGDTAENGAYLTG